MIRIRKAHERGHFDHGWLDTRHTFSFGDYYDKDHVGFRTLRVINEDRVQPGGEFGTHGHRDMEIISHVLEGELTHHDSMGNGSVIRPGDVQRMTAGSGIMHSEANNSASVVVHFLQIWILPDRKSLSPEYEQKTIPDADKLNRLCLVASPDGKGGSVRIHQDVSLFVSILESGKTLDYDLAPGRHAWIQIARGSVDLNGHLLTAGDGAAISDETALRLSAREKSEFLLFDLA